MYKTTGVLAKNYGVLAIGLWEMSVTANCCLVLFIIYGFISKSHKDGFLAFLVFYENGTWVRFKVNLSTFNLITGSLLVRSTDRCITLEENLLSKKYKVDRFCS